MTSVKVFISHSTKTDQNAEILAAVCEALQNDFNILVDKQIRPNEEWFPCLNEYMMECHAAVILLSQAALQSEWVKAEAAVLCHRRRSQSDFKLILVPFEGVDAELLDQQPFFKTIRLTDFQTIRDCQTTNDRITKLKEALQDLVLPPTPFDELTTLIREVIKQLKVNDQTLSRVWATLNDAPLGVDHADALARILLRDPSNIFTCLRTLFEKLAHILTQQQAKKLIELIKGHWVNPAAAAALCIAREADPPVAVAINGVEVADFTGHSYSRKAWPFPQEYTLVSVGADRTFKDIQQTLQNSLGKSAVNSSRAEARVKGYKHPLLLVFPYPEHDGQANYQESLFPDEGLIKEIQSQYKNITVVLSTGSYIQDNQDYLLRLEPALEENQEELQCQGYEDVMYYVTQNIAD